MATYPLNATRILVRFIREHDPQNSRKHKNNKTSQQIKETAMAFDAQSSQAKLHFSLGLLDRRRSMCHIEPSME